MLPSDAIDTDGEAGIEVSAYREEGVGRVESSLLAGADHHGIVEPRVSLMTCFEVGRYG